MEWARIVVRWLAVFAVLHALPATAADDEQSQPAAASGKLIRVQLPITGNADEHIKSSIGRAVDALTGRATPRDTGRPVLILEIAPARNSNEYGLGSNFERALSLARFLSSDRDLAAVKTVAYVPNSIKGHGVLVAMACEEIVMHPDAELGEAGADEDLSRPIEPSIVSSYQQIVSARRTVPEAIALGMLEPSLAIHKVETENATEFVLSDEVAELEATSSVVSDEVIVPTGSLGWFTGSEGRRYRFVKYVASDHDALARVLELPPEAVVEDQSLVGDWRPVMIDVEGPITPRVVGQLRTLMATEKEQRNINWIGFRIDSTGGSLEHCLKLADMIVSQDPTEVRTVAYVPVEASGGAELVALACDQLVLQPAARIGGAPVEDEQNDELDAATRAVLQSFADDAGLNWSLLAAMNNAEVEVFTYTNTKTGAATTMSVEEAKTRADAGDWRKGPAITRPGEPLVLTSGQAQDLRLAWQIVDNFDEFKQLYGFADDPRLAKPNLALELVEALSNPALAVMLLVVGFIGIYLELHSPGFGIGGFVAAVAFLLFFWSKFLDGTADWLEILLFVSGVVFILLEVFVLPGFGVFGVGGSVMMILALVLASQTFLLPHSEAELIELRNSLAIVLVAGAAVIGLALVLRRWLPNAPLFRMLLLDPPATDELAELEHRESTADFAHLVGQCGTASTDLLPAGKAMINGHLLDVIADGDVIERGQAVEVTTARGNRVLVRLVEV